MLETYAEAPVGTLPIRFPEQPLRILADSELWQGGDSYAYVRAFRRAGHSVAVVSAGSSIPSWRATWLRALRRVLEPAMVAEHNRRLVAEARHLRPHLFFAFKGPHVNAEAVRAIKAMGVIAINLYPDVSFMSHGKYLPRALPLYDWVFTTKTFGLDDMKRRLGIANASFIPPAFDPEVHAAFSLDASDVSRYCADVSFIGTWSPKKERLLCRVREALPQMTLRIWGSHWDLATSPNIKHVIEHQVVTGAEYAKCIRASRINLGLLSEVGEGASSGDQITARTFHIPASGGFMLHERTEEVAQYFREGVECALYGDDAELVEKVRYYLAHEDERQRIAESGCARGLASGYAVDARIAEVLARYHKLVEPARDSKVTDGRRSD